MMLCKLSFKNIRKSFKDYAIYFFTLILGVAIFYVFNAIDSQTVMINVSSSTKEIIQLMNQMLSGVSVFVSFILGFLIIYASRFLIRRRNREFGIYLTLGMSKRKISAILLIETLLIGVLSLVVGLGLGVVLSQFMSLLVANMFEADLTNFQFVFSSSACIKTLGYFSIMYLVVMIFNTVNISRCKLIDLIQANRKSEKVKMKNPYVCIVVFIISAIFLGYAYWRVTGDVESMAYAGEILVIMAIGAISTFFIFWSLSGLLLRIVQSNKKFYYKGLNSFILRQISSKINTTVLSMTTICLMLFITICVLSSALSIKNSMTANLTTLAPADIEIDKNLDLVPNNRVTEAQAEDSHLSVRETLERLDFDVDAYFKDIVDFNVYATNDLTIRDTLGSSFEKIKNQFPNLMYDSAEAIVRESDYNQVTSLFHLEPVHLEDDEYVVIADFDSWVMIRDEALKMGESITLNGNVYYPKYEECIDGFLEMSSNHINTGFFVVPDDAVDESIRAQNIMIANYKAETDEEKQEIEDKIVQLDNHPYASSTTISASSKIAIYEGSVGLGACVTFIGLYLGIIFLISCAAILALKELSESSDNRERYTMLRKIGTDEKMIKRALFRQIAIFFLFPLVIAIIHSIFGIMFCNFILETFGNKQLLYSIIMTAIFIVVIYGGYFLVTYFCSKNIIRAH